jgi:hypothetical protein
MPGWIMSEPTSTPPSPADATGDTFDPQRRRLCADDSCVGIVGPDGRCRVCGQAHPDGPGDGATFSPAATLDADADDLAEADDVAVAADGAQLGSDAGNEGGFNASRPLCPDGSCVGVLGSDGRCKVCGRTAESAGETGA